MGYMDIKAKEANKPSLHLLSNDLSIYCQITFSRETAI